MRKLALLFAISTCGCVFSNPDTFIVGVSPGLDNWDVPSGHPKPERLALFQIGLGEKNVDISVSCYGEPPETGGTVLADLNNLFELDIGVNLTEYFYPRRSMIHPIARVNGGIWIWPNMPNEVGFLTIISLGCSINEYDIVINHRTYWNSFDSKPASAWNIAFFVNIALQ